jgi:hypothetical protein
MDVIPIDSWQENQQSSLWRCEQLEQGNVLLLNQTPFLPSEADSAFLREQHQSDKAYHKNIAYKPRLDRTTGTADMTQADAERVHRILADYSRGALEVMAALLPEYAPTWTVDYASFRPVEEAGRVLPLRHRNDLIHLDAFPTRPTHGGRILRLFTNLHPDRTRVWATSDPFEELAVRYARPAGLSQVTGPLAKAGRAAGQLARKVGLRIPDRSPYDEFMLRFHHYLKSCTEFQQAGPRKTVAFRPGATWISFTDQVAHAVLSGQYALEQTCVVPYEAMTLPELSPVAVLERLAGRPLIERAAARSKPERIPA